MKDITRIKRNARYLALAIRLLTSGQINDASIGTVERLYRHGITLRINDGKVVGIMAA